MTFRLGEQILYLGAAAVEAAGLGLAEVEAAVEAMFLAKAAGRAAMRPKLALHAEGGTLFLASPGVLGKVAGVKWVGVADNRERRLPHIAGTIVLSDAATGMPLAIMDARWITQVRTAAISAVTARRLARADSAAIGFIACGVQARAHLSALRRHFRLTRVRAYSRSLRTAEAFAAEARAQGLEAQAVAEPRRAVEGMDIVVTTTPVVPPTEPFLDAAWLSPGAFTSMVDLGFSWQAASLVALDRLVTDDIAQAGSERLPATKAFAGEVADLVAGRLPARVDASERTALVFAGIGLADVAVAAALHAKALERRIGKLLAM